MMWTIAAALATLPFGNILRFSLGAGAALLAVDVFVGLSALTFLPRVWRNRKRLYEELWFKLLASFLIVAAASLFTALIWLGPMQAFISALYGLRLLAYSIFLAGFSLLEKPKRHRALMWLSVSGVLIAGAGYAQYLLYPDLRNLYYAGWDEHLYRMFGTFLDPNFFGASMVLISGLLFSMRDVLLKRFPKWLLFSVCAALAGAIVLTYSRSTYLMLLTSGFVYALLGGRWRIVGGAFIILVLGVLLIPKDLGGEGVNLFRTASINQRIQEYQEAGEIFRTSPLIGVGFNAYRYAQLRHGYIDLETWQHDHAGAGVPNSFLFVLATTGIAGLIVYIGFWTALVRQLYRKRKIVLLSVLMGLLVHAQFENSLFYPFILLILFVWVGYEVGDE